MVVAFEFQEFGAASVGAGQAQCQHRGFAAGISEAHYFGGRDHSPETLRRFDFR